MYVREKNRERGRERERERGREGGRERGREREEERVNNNAIVYPCITQTLIYMYVVNGGKHILMHVPFMCIIT